MLLMPRLLLILFLSVLAMPVLAETHRYVMEDSELRVYPVDIAMTRRAQHAALYTLADTMIYGVAEERMAFAKAALYEMAGLFEEEALRSAPSGREGFNYAHWRNQTLDFATELYQAANSIEITTPLDVVIVDTGEMHIIINSKLYILTSPQITKPHALDERIINHVCSARYCDPELLAITENKFKRTIVIEAIWDVTEDNTPEYQTIDGLHFLFTDMENRSKKQIAALKVIKEVKFIAETLKDAKSKGVPLELASLTIKPFQGSYDYRISLNTFGDTVYLKLPELHQVNHWQETFMPWIKAQVENEEYEQYLDGDEVLARKLK